MRESIHSSDLRQRSKSEASLYKLGCPRFGGADTGYVLSGRMHAVTDKISGDVQDGQRTTGRESQFDKIPSTTSTVYNIPYDYKSVMHYGKAVYAQPGTTTIETLDPTYAVQR
ncbi:hypothetical protein KIN20_015242 [Parelaphostrongylus tenuis]|uniref:Peptidase M12A domain-containing protein n=1 Tax=Parelaphostrongylus tenuis TaxID=148309 RepID=A0AAD5MJ85_PARTN|nr:hypothetical protein KIN20_015242 [Parelaphostrongylus tenuis]